MGLFGNICTAGKGSIRSHALTFPCRSHGEKVSLGTELCHLGERVTRVKSNCSSYPLQCIPTCIIFAPTARWNFSTGLLDFPQGSLICG